MRAISFVAMVVIAAAGSAVSAQNFAQNSSHGNNNRVIRVQADLAILPTAIDEMLRYHPPVLHFRRTAMRDVELRGQTIREGDKVGVWYVSANRDEEVFRDPDRFDVGRTPNDHLSFGFGPHFCLGAALAHLEARVMFEELFQRLPDIAVVEPPVRLRANHIHGIKHLPVRFTPEARRTSA